MGRFLNEMTPHEEQDCESHNQQPVIQSEIDETANHELTARAGTDVSLIRL